MRAWLLALTLIAHFAGGAFAQEDKKTDDLKPSDPDTGESTVQEIDPRPSAKSFREKRHQVCRDVLSARYSAIPRAARSRVRSTKIASILPWTSISRRWSG